jgi:hypothetical protein
VEAGDEEKNFKLAFKDALPTRLALALRSRAGRQAFINFFQNHPPSLRFGEAGSQNFQDLGE